MRDVLPATLAAQQAGFRQVIVPLRQAGKARLVAGIDVIGIASITQLVAFLRDKPMPLVDPIEVMGNPAGKHAKRRLDLADVVGQVEAKWACEVAAARRHDMLFHGPTGVGKTILEGGGEAPVGGIGGGRRSCRRGTRQTGKPTGRYSMADQQ